jgi:nicotinamide mononucleotide adenylyltransferase
MTTYDIVSGVFDPIHERHISVIKDVGSRADGVIVLLNSDAWLCRKKRQEFYEICNAHGNL